MDSRTKGRLVVAWTVGMAVVLAWPAAAQTVDEEPRTQVGASAGLGVLLGDSRYGDGPLDVPRYIGITARQTVRGASVVAVRVNASYGFLNPGSPRDGLDARTALITLLAGPELFLALGPLQPFVHPVIGLAGTRLSGTTQTASDPNATRDVSGTSWAVAWGALTGLRFVSPDPGTTTLELGIALVDMGELTFVRPGTDTFHRSPTGIHLQLALSFHLP